jgi:hypothetical protein
MILQAEKEFMTEKEKSKHRIGLWIFSFYLTPIICQASSTNS